jgi:hypothetical protein
MFRLSIPAEITPVRARFFVLGVALAFLAFKVWLAATTHGTNDVDTFFQFATAIVHTGPAEIYGVPHPGADLYNHPPLTGDMLWVLKHLSDQGIGFGLLIRLPAILADLVTSLLVFELVRNRRGDPRAAMWAGIGAASSPILVVISGFHGNTDPVFVMFVLLAVWLLSSRELPLWAGAALGIALSVKVVPLVVVPVLLLWALLRGRRTLLLLAAGLAVTIAVIWTPAVWEHWPQVRDNVLGYAGWSAPQWGIAQVLSDLGLSRPQLVQVLAHARTPVVALSAALGAVLVWRRRDALGPAVGLTLGCLLLLSTATGTQYLAWAAAGLFLADLWTALLYNLVGGVFLCVLYTHWSHGTWNVARGALWSPGDTRLGLLAWAALIAAVVCGVRGVLAAPRPTPDVRTPDVRTTADGTAPQTTPLTIPAADSAAGPA